MTREKHQEQPVPSSFEGESARNCGASDKLPASATALLLSPEVAATRIIFATEETKRADHCDLIVALKELTDAVRDHGAQPLETMLATQSVALQSVFARFMERAMGQSQLENFETFARLALKAQAQSARTVQILGELRNPRAVAFVKQANIANQQVVNQDTDRQSRAGECGFAPNQLSGEIHELRPDIRTSRIAGRVDPSLGTVEAINRPSEC